MKVVHIIHVLNVVFAFAAARAAPARYVLWSMAISMLVHILLRYRTTPFIIAILAPMVFTTSFEQDCVVTRLPNLNVVVVEQCDIHHLNMLSPDRVLAAAAFMFFSIGYELEGRRDTAGISQPDNAVSEGHRSHDSAVPI